MGNTSSVDGSQFEDDEAINEQENLKNSAENAPKYDIEKGLSLDVKSLHKHFQFNSVDEQVIPIMVSVKTLNKTWEDLKEKEPAKESSSRSNIDLVCVIDNSGSMEGEKLANVKATLRLLLDLMGENDRICLITFNSTGTRICKLMKTSQKNRRVLLNIIGLIFSTGGTDINSGMELAFQVLRDRVYRNPVSSVFLLSDGQDGGAETNVQHSIQKYLPEECFTIHSFGFGNDHDAPMMNKICSMKDGNFYYVEKIDQVDEFFVDALGGLFSVVAQDIFIDIQVNLQNILFEGARVSKTFGTMFNTEKANERYSIKINQLFSGVSKDFIFEIVVPAKKIDSINDEQRNYEIVSASLSALPLNHEYTTKITKESKLILTVFTQDEKIAQDSEVNDSVEFNYLRVQASEAMKNAMNKAEDKAYEISEQILDSMIKRCDKLDNQNNAEKIKVIKRDLKECKDNSKPQVYEYSGRTKMMWKMNANSKQTSQAVESCDLYQNEIQTEMVQKARKNKGLFGSSS